MVDGRIWRCLLSKWGKDKGEDHSKAFLHGAWS
jgi:hypothetical protein